MQNLFIKTQETKLENFLPKNAIETTLENALYVVATPIGNLSDITLRALQVLRQVDALVCEDTRVSQKLLSAFKIKAKKLITYNDQADEKSRQKIFVLLKEGKSLALVSDAGTPLISDPGYKLINFLRNQNQKIIPIPGASAMTASLSVSGLACDNFLFLGFLPNSEIQKKKLLDSLPKNFTFLFFESANRLVETLQLIGKNLGNRKACAARELTKIYEEIITDDLTNLIEFFLNHPEKLRGEFVVIIEKMDKREKSISEPELSKEISKAILAGHSLKDLSKNLAEIYGLNKKEVYQLALSLTKNS